MKSNSMICPDEDSMRITLSGLNQLITEKNKCMIGSRQVVIGQSVHSENKRDRCGDSFTKKSKEKTVHLHKHDYGLHILAEQ
ncbi:hypothetical protein TNCV_1802551 [Trichonephila clavipes]|uniref:Uncharacterized protein n=1 Tax=Trichonephila clavipes TaxID=2585209 RepID=A0A8X6VHY0_TRICX|nr:hypothetical protein TNCV_1802551 [Trichonephila clavipes]